MRLPPVRTFFKDLRRVQWSTLPLYIVHRFTDFWPNGYMFSIWRASLLRLFGFKIKKTGHFGKDIFVLNYEKLTIGENSGVNNQAYFDCMDAEITIGDGCNIGFRACFITGIHELNTDYKMNRPLIAQKPIIIQDFVWIAANVTILPGVTVGRGSVVAAGSLVTKDVEENSLVMGVPARKIRSLVPGESLAQNE